MQYTRYLNLAVKKALESTLTDPCLIDGAWTGLKIMNSSEKNQGGLLTLNSMWTGKFFRQ
jgi:hypothetical protein